MMKNNETFEQFNHGTLKLPASKVDFSEIAWSKHPTFEGVELKHIITGKDTDGQFSYHLVRIAPGKSIGSHIHATQLETHEVIGGTGFCLNDGARLEYACGTMSIFRMSTPHEVTASDEGLYLFAKFFPALC